MKLHFKTVEETDTYDIDHLVYVGECNEMDLSKKILSLQNNKNYEALSKEKDKILFRHPSECEGHCVFVVTPQDSLYIDLDMYFIYRELCRIKYNGEIRTKQIRVIDELILPILREKKIDQLLTTDIQ